jgi:serine/threonine-protein kinase HipA
VRSFFDNLLPDSDQIRERVQARYGTPSIEAFDLLQEIGRDCVGAVQLLRPEDHPDDVHRINADPLNEPAIEQILAGTLVSGRHQENDDFRISIAGVQEKTALLWYEGKWCRPHGSTPTTHIFKLPLGVAPSGIDLTHSVENEWLCSQFLRAYGVPVANCERHRFGEMNVLVVERFDRRLADDRSWFIRLPQEDLAQATGTPPSKKYESEGGPGVRTLMDLLLGSNNAEADRLDFFRTQVVFWLLCAIDGHAKNFSIFLEPLGRYRLTPRYDVLSAYPVMGRGPRMLSPERVKMAMAVLGKNRHYRWAEISRRHFEMTARLCGISHEGKRIIDELVEVTPKVVDQVGTALPKDFPEAQARPILDGLSAAAQRLGTKHSTEVADPR